MSRRCCCGPGDPDCCACRSCKVNFIVYVDFQGEFNSAPAVTGGPCEFTITNMSQGPAVVRLIASPSGPIWEGVYNGVTYQTDPLPQCDGAFSWTSGGFGSISVAAEPCHPTCCIPGKTLRVVEYGEAMVNFLQDEVTSGFKTRPGGEYCVAGVFSPPCSCERCTTIREDLATWSGFQSFNGSYPAKLIDGATGQEVPPEDLAAALAMDLTQMAACQAYWNWRWEFYAVDSTIGLADRLDQGDAFICNDPGCPDVPLGPVIISSPEYRVNLVAPNYGYKETPSPRNVSSFGGPGTPCPTPKDFIGGQPGCFQYWNELSCQEPDPPQRDPVSSIGQWRDTAVPFIKCIDENEPDLGATNYYTAVNMEAVRHLTGAWFSDCCNCDADYTIDFLQEMLTATFQQNWIYQDYPVPCT